MHRFSFRSFEFMCASRARNFSKQQRFLQSIWESFLQFGKSGMQNLEQNIDTNCRRKLRRIDVNDARLFCAARLVRCEAGQTFCCYCV